MPIFGGTEAEMELDLKANKLIEEINNIKRINTALENTTKYFDTGNLRIKSRVSLLSSILMILVNGSDVTKKGTKKM